MMDWKARRNAIGAGYDVRWARADRAEYHGRTREEARELRCLAAKSAAICGECFRPLAPMDSVTMEARQIGGSRGKGTDRWVRVPVCLFCTLDAMLGPFHSEPRYHRARCRNCGRPLRLHWMPSLAAQTCCDDCQRLATNKRNAERRRVTHAPMTCIECGRQFIPKRADAVTCSNRCRQAQHRKRERGGVEHPLRGEQTRTRTVKPDPLV
jgi:hypothetical protein